MNQVISWLKNIGLRQILAVFFVAIIFLVVPGFTSSKAFQSHAWTVLAATAPYKADSTTVKRIQEKAEDLGDSYQRPIGDTGLKNIKKLGENIPETLELNRRQGFFSGEPDNLSKRDALDDVQDQVEGAVKGTKRVLKDATS
jgi:hypothetical protein